MGLGEADGADKIGLSENDFYNSRDSRRPTECVSPRIPRGASALSLPRRIFSSLGNGGKKSGGGSCPG